MQLSLTGLLCATLAAAAVGQNLPRPNFAASAVKTFTLYGGPWRVDGQFDSIVHLKSGARFATLSVTPTLYMEDGTAVALAPVSLPPGVNGDLDLAQLLAKLPPGETTLWGSIALSFRGRFADELMAAMDVFASGSSGLSTDFSYLPGSFAPPPTVPLVPGPNATPLQKRLIQDENKHIAAKAAALAGGSAPPSGEKPLEALWARPSPVSMGWLALTNTGSTAAVVDWKIFGSAGSVVDGPTITVAPHGTQMLGLASLIQQLPAAEQNAGGLEVEPHTAKRQILAEAAFYDSQNGATTALNLQMKGWGLGHPVLFRFAVAGLPLGPQPPSLGFPSAANFAPSLSLRNTTSARLPLTIRITVSSEADPPARACALMVPLVLAPMAERDLPLAPTLAAAGCPPSGMVNLMLHFRGRRGDLEVAARSAAGRGEYQLQGGVHQIERLVTFGEGMIYWTDAGNATTLFTIWNPARYEQRLRVKFDSGEGVSFIATKNGAACKGCYYVNLDLPPGASETLSTAALRSAAPDMQGNTFPAATEGSFVITSAAEPLPDAHGRIFLPPSGLPPMRVIVGESVVGRATGNGLAALGGRGRVRAQTELAGTCTSQAGAEAGDPCGYSTDYIDNANYVGDGQSTQFTLWAQEAWDQSVSINLTSGASWTSKDTSVATVSSAYPDWGKVTGVSAGNVEIEATVNVPVSTDGGCHCYYQDLPAYAYINVTTCGDPPGLTAPDGEYGSPTDRGQIINEYQVYGVMDDSACPVSDPTCAADHPFVPACGNFTASATNPNYTFSEIKGSGSVYNWAIIQAPLVEGGSIGLSAWISDYEGTYGAGLPALDSGYRTPTYNASLGGAAQSRHMFGDAADLDAGDNSTIFNQLTAAANNAGANYVEPNSMLKTPYSHVHADWRNYDATPTFQP